MNSIKRYSLPVLSLFILTGLFSSCSSIPQKRIFTQQLYKDSGLTGSDLFKVQFFLDRDILIYRSLSSNESNVEEGRITIRGGEQVQEVIIKRGTKGALVYMPKDDRLGISFDASNDNKYLMFGPNSKNGNKYSLLASEWEQGSGTVTYGDAKWRTLSGSAYATLLVDLSSYQKTEVSTEIPKGREVN